MQDDLPRNVVIAVGVWPRARQFGNIGQKSDGAGNVRRSDFDKPVKSRAITATLAA
jgi:hypothetical protein